MEKQEFDQLAQLLFSADFDSVKTALITLQGVLNDDDILSTSSILYKDNADCHLGLYRAILQKNDVIFIISFGNDNEYINISINFKYYQRKSIASDVDFFAYAGITHCLKGECISHAKWLCYGFPSDLSDFLGSCPSYSKINPLYDSVAAYIDKQTIYNVLTDCIVSNATEAELIDQE